MNDPNGLVFHDGEYHLFFQHNSRGWWPGFSSWGHAVSPDLVGWTELPVAIPSTDEEFVLSGSAVVDAAPGGTLTLKVPAHGVVFVPQDPGSGTPLALPTLSLTGFTPLPTTFLDGSTPEAWRVKSRTAPVALSTTKITHVILRRPLQEEILADPVFPAPEGARCTYMCRLAACRAASMR